LFVLVVFCYGLAANAPARAGQPKLAPKPKPKVDSRQAMSAMTAASTEGLYLLVDLSGEANANFAPPLGKGLLASGGVPFHLPRGDKDCLSLRQAQWNGWQQDVPWSHEAAVPNGPHDPCMPILRVPVADYLAAHLLAVADDDAHLTPAFTLRMGRFPRDGNSQCVQFDFAGQVPRRSELAKVAAQSLVKTGGQTLCWIRVPTRLAYAQDMDPGRPLEIEVTKEVRLARRNPDPARFRYRPLGLPSGVRIAAFTLEKSPLQMQVTSEVPAHAFAEPQVPTFQVALTNITSVAQDYQLALAAAPLRGAKLEAARSGRVAPGQTASVSVPLAVPRRGYYDLTVTLSDGKRNELLRRETSFALLPPDSRKHRDQSPFGTYDYGATHFCCGDYDRVGPLYVKLGMRYGMFAAPAEFRRKYGLLKGNEPQMQMKTPGSKEWDRILAQHPDLPPMAVIFHEACISEKHITRVPDLFTGRPAYTFDATEAAAFQDMWNKALTACQAMRQEHPEVQLALGNGPPTLKEEFFRRKFPAKLFDSAGNESISCGHPPEAQPPDYLGNNSSLWMDRQLLDAYGYKDKAVTQCHEVCYPATNPGNLDFRTQADYFVRHAMHSLAWGVPVFRPGILMDVGGNYRWSHWGASGFCHVYPEMNVKPAFMAFATMTLLLDGAKFVREVPLGSPSLYAVEFARPDGSSAFVLWALRGERPVTLSLEGTGPWKLVDDQAIETAAKPADGRLEVTFTPSPCYLIGKGRLAGGASSAAVYTEKPEGKATPLAALDKLDDWIVESGRSMELEYYDFMTPRRKGDFSFEAVPKFEGRGGAIRVTPKPITHGKDAMPMYAVLAHKTGILMPGTPTEIGLWINGNSSWGRVIFELSDASGQRWISLGAQAKLDPQEFLSKDVLARFPSPGISDWNTEDAWGLSRINFDGWRYVAFPLPGNYPGEHYGWPANSQWRWDKDGVVRYPLTLKKLVVELNEKVLHLTTFTPPPRPAIYLKDLLVGQGDTVLLKRTVGE
jgi:hypothetical protein